MDEKSTKPIGSFCWNELMTRDGETAKKFYTALFGWDTRLSPLHGSYNILVNKGSEIGGIMQMGEEIPNTPPHWMPYVAVENVDASCEKVKELGGKVCVPPTDIPNVGRFAVISDPTGATLSIITLK